MDEGARSVSERRRYLVAVALAVLSVGGLAAYVLATTWWAGSSVSPEARPRPVPVPGTSAPSPEQLASDVVVPEGDYDAFCERLQIEAGLGGADLSASELVSLLEGLDYPGLVDAAPPAIRPAIETVRDGVDELVAELAESGSSGVVDPADFDAELLDAVELLGQVAIVECSGQVPN